jgi:hypothetical protein
VLLMICGCAGMTGYLLFQRGGLDATTLSLLLLLVVSVLYWSYAQLHLQTWPDGDELVISGLHRTRRIARSQIRSYRAHPHLFQLYLHGRHWPINLQRLTEQPALLAWLNGLPEQNALEFAAEQARIDHDPRLGRDAAQRRRRVHNARWLARLLWFSCCALLFMAGGLPHAPWLVAIALLQPALILLLCSYYDAAFTLVAPDYQTRKTSLRHDLSRCWILSAMAALKQQHWSMFQSGFWQPGHLLPTLLVTVLLGLLALRITPELRRAPAQATFFGIALLAYAAGLVTWGATLPGG